MCISIDMTSFQREYERASRQIPCRQLYLEGLFFGALFLGGRPFAFAQERKKEATRTWREQNPKPQKECWVTLSRKRSVGLQNLKPQKECWGTKP